MNNVKKYKRKVKKQFEFLSPNGKNMLNTFFHQIDEFPDVNNLSYQELIEQFGEPTDIYSSYIENTDEDTHLYRQKAKRKKVIIVSTAIVASIVIFFVATFAYLSYEAQKSFITREEVQIIEE